MSVLSTGDSANINFQDSPTGFRGFSTYPSTDTIPISYVSLCMAFCMVTSCGQSFVLGESVAVIYATARCNLVYHFLSLTSVRASFHPILARPRLKPS